MDVHISLWFSVFVSLKRNPGGGRHAQVNDSEQERGGLTKEIWEDTGYQSFQMTRKRSPCIVISSCQNATSQAAGRKSGGCYSC